MQNPGQRSVQINNPRGFLLLFPSERRPLACASGHCLEGGPGVRGLDLGVALDVPHEPDGADAFGPSQSQGRGIAGRRAFPQYPPLGTMRVILSLLALSIVAGCGGGDPSGEEEREQVDAQQLIEMQEALDDRAGSSGGLWTGTLSIIEAADEDIVGPSNGFAQETISVTLEHRVLLDVNGRDVAAQVTYSLKELTDSRMDYDQYTLAGLVDKKTAAEGRSVGEVDVTFYGDGTYAINFSVEGIRGTFKIEERSTSTCKPSATECADKSSVTNDTADETGLGYMSGSVLGTGGEDADRLSGTQADDIEFRDPTVARRVVTWDLHR